MAAPCLQLNLVVMDMMPKHAETSRDRERNVESAGVPVDNL